jgi:hypothetical protein
MSNNWELKAKQRVQADKDLSFFENIILGNAYKDGPGTFKWIATAPVADIVAWAEELEEEEADLEKENAKANSQAN